MNLDEVISSDPDIEGGAVVFAGTRGERRIIRG
jgi:uncharacterized protein (DUF433 family)